MIKREITQSIKRSADKYPVIGVVGPRQSGKTTLVKNIFSRYTYVNLENPQTRSFAQADPEGFFATYRDKVIIDEIQRVPSLFSYIQTIVDKRNKPAQFVITGSANFLLMESISQSLAGRISLFTLLGLSFTEIKKTKPAFNNYYDYLFRGGYPRVYTSAIDPPDWYANYVQTYIERDIRQIKNITDLSSFQIFLKLCAGRIGQLVNLSDLGKDAGITHNTAKAWLSLLEASFIIVFLRPHFRNFNKRIIKSPKLYFLDTGLALWLLGITHQDQLPTNYLIGSIFENWVITEYIKYSQNRHLAPDCYFFRDRSGHEIDLVIDKNNKLIPIEIKSGKTINSDFFTNLIYYQQLSKTRASGKLIYGGEEKQTRSQADIYPYRKMISLFEEIHRK